jgi:hypothetical protein
LSIIVVLVVLLFLMPMDYLRRSTRLSALFAKPVSDLGVSPLLA